MTKRLYILAGPNGSGKSTLYKTQFSSLPFVNPNLIEGELETYSVNSPLLAARIALKIISECLTQNQSFVVETTLTGNVERRLFDQAKALGWEIYLHFVCLKTSDLHIRRIEERFRRGGHFIPADVVIRRYQRSLETLPKVLPKADFAWLYDNSSLEGFELLAQFEGGRVVYQAEELPRWAREILR